MPLDDTRVVVFAFTFQEGNSARIFIDPVDEARMDWFASDEPGFWLICKHDPERNGDYKQAFLESFKSKEVAFEEQCELWDDIHDRIGESAAGRAVEFEIITHEQALEKYGAETLAQAREEKSISDIFDQLADMHSDFPLDSSKEYIEAAFSVPIKEAVAA